jgi:hypothetical protein
MRLLERLHQREFDPAWRLKCDVIGTTAAIIAGSVAAAGAVGSAAIGAHAAGSAANVQATAEQKVADMATKAGTDAQTDVSGALADINTQLAPYLQAGSSGLVSLENALAPGGSLSQQFSFNPSDLQNEPGYQFQLNEGMKALQNSAAAKGAALSSGTQKTLAGYAEGLAGTSFQNAYNRALTTFQTNRNNTLQPLQTLIGVGQQAVGQYGNANLSGQEYIGNAGLEATQLAGSALVGKANAQASGIMGQANAWGGALSTIGNMGQQVMSAGLNPSSPYSSAPTALPESAYPAFNPTGYTPTTAQMAMPLAPPAPTYAPYNYNVPTQLPGTSMPSLPNYAPVNVPGLPSYSAPTPLSGALPPAQYNYGAGAPTGL